MTTSEIPAVERERAVVASEVSDPAEVGDPAGEPHAHRHGEDAGLSSWQLLLFACPAIPLAALYLPIGFFLPPFYTGGAG